MKYLYSCIHQFKHQVCVSTLQNTEYNPEIYIYIQPHSDFIRITTTAIYNTTTPQPYLLYLNKKKQKNDIPILPPNRRLRPNPLPPPPLTNILPPPHRQKHRNPRPHRRLASLPHRPQAIPPLAQRPAASFRGRHLGRAAPPAPGYAGTGRVCKGILRREGFGCC